MHISKGMHTYMCALHIHLYVRMTMLCIIYVHAYICTFLLLSALSGETHPYVYVHVHMSL